jgi:hypothetical protein
VCPLLGQILLQGLNIRLKYQIRLCRTFLEISQNYEKCRRATIYEIFFGEFEIHLS